MTGTSLTTSGYGFQEQMTLAKELVTTGFLPSSVKTPAQALAIIQTGKELGIGPMHALRSIHIIQGKPTLSAELQLAMFKAKGGRAVWKESTETKATLWLKHPNGDEHEETFTIEDARRANLLGKDGWKMYAKAMLRARTSSAGLRAVAPDIVAGIYDPEELGADLNERGEVVLPPSTVETEVEPNRDAQHDGPTDKQLVFFAKLLKSSVWTEEEVEGYKDTAQAATRESMTALLDEILTEGKRRDALRKAESAEKKEAVESGAD